MTTQSDKSPLASLELGWLNDAAQVLMLNTKTPLQAYCWAKRIEERMKEVQSALRRPANDEFEELRKSSAKLTKWPIEEFAVLTNNAARGSWRLPKDLVERQAILDSDVDAWKKEHKDAYTEGELDPDKAPLFKIAIMR